MPSEADRALVVAEFDSAKYPSGAPTLETAWLGIYQVLWWYEHELLHVREANDLKRNPAWQERARQAERYLASNLQISPERVPGLVDRMMSLPRWHGMQRNNPLGNGLRFLTTEVLQRWGDDRLTYTEELNATHWFPGIRMAGRSRTPAIDVAVSANGVPAAVISCKWSIRHDRISDPTNECTTYKAAAIQQQNMGLRYYVVTSEMDSQRLDKVLDQECVDALVHVHLDLACAIQPALAEKTAEDRRKGRLLDLTELIALTSEWT